MRAVERPEERVLDNALRPPRRRIDSFPRFLLVAGFELVVPLFQVVVEQVSLERLAQLDVAEGEFGFEPFAV